MDVLEHYQNKGFRESLVVQLLSFMAGDMATEFAAALVVSPADVTKNTYCDRKTTLRRKELDFDIL